MMKRLRKRNKKGGFIVTAELILIATILVLGLLVGMAELRDSLVAELDDVADAFGSLSQSYTFNGVSNQNGPPELTAGSFYIDQTDPGQGELTYGGDGLDINTSIFPGPENQVLAPTP